MSRRRPLADLDPGIREELNRLLLDGRHTIRQVTDHLRKLGVDASKSAVGRYSIRFEEEAKDARMVRELALAVGKEVEDIADGGTVRMLVESLQALVLYAKKQMTDEQQFDARSIADLAKALKDLQLATKASVETRARLRKEFADEAAKAAEAVATAQGISATTIDAIKARILGLKEQHGPAATA